jgi:hypothetical protein
MLARFKTVSDPANSEGFLVTFETVGGLVPETTTLTVAFKSQFDLDSAFMAAGIYLRDVTHPGPERTLLPDPERDYQVTSDSLRLVGFDIPKSTGTNV